MMPHIMVFPSRPGAAKISGAIHPAALILLRSAWAKVCGWPSFVLRNTVTGARSAVEYLSTSMV